MARPGVSGSASSSSAAARERVLLSERSSVIVPGHVSADERVGIHARECIPVGERVRVPEPPLVRLSVSDPDLGLAYILGPEDADADHISTDIGTAEHAPIFGTCNFGTCNFGTARIHAGEHSIIRIGSRVCVAAPGEKGQYVALGARRHSPGSRSPACWARGLVPAGAPAAQRLPAVAAGLVIGSPGFMSPEQAAGFEVGPPSDIFSLGAVLAFAATGEGPFGTGTTAALLYRVVHGTPGLDRIPSEVRPLIERCLAKDPTQRPTAAGPAGRWRPSGPARTPT